MELDNTQLPNTGEEENISIFTLGLGLVLVAGSGGYCIRRRNKIK